MNQYQYKAVTQEGKYVRGKISAKSPGELSAILKDDKLEVISFKIERDQIFSFRLGSVKPTDLVTTFIHLEQLGRAGITIIDAISDLRDSSDSSSVKSLMQEIHESIKSGSLFSEAMAKRPDIFSSVYVGLVASGEKTGNLSNSFSSIVEDLKWNIGFKRKIKKAAIGPSFAILMMCGIIALMMGLVVPKVTGFLSMQGIELPLATTLLIATSKFIQTQWFTIIIAIISIYVSLKLIAKIDNIGVKLDRIKLRIPVIGKILVKLDAARFCKFFSMTFRSGLGIIQCLDSASLVIKNDAFRRNVSLVKVQVSEGQSLAKSISESRYFPPLVTRMFKVGEESGNMEDALHNITFFYDQEINDSIDNMVRMIQPALTVIMGSLILWVVTAVFGPIYSSFSNI